MPVMKPTYSAAATVTFMNSWNSYLWPLVILAANPKNHTMPMYVSNLMGGYVLDFGQIMLAVTITTIPTVVIFFMLQKNFVEGILGSVKQ
jgi:lactose/L-arabinose transport system permease protein